VGVREVVEMILCGDGGGNGRAMGGGGRRVVKGFGMSSMLVDVFT